jgi:hypothetical protein
MPKNKTSDKFQQQVSSHFKRSAQKKLPGIDKLDLDDAQWRKLERRYLAKGRNKLTALFLLQNITSILNVDYASLLEMLKKRSPREHQPNLHQEHTHYRLRRFYHRKFNKENKLILSSNQSDPSLHSPLKQLNVRIVPHLLPATPDAHNTPRYKTPGLQTRVRSVYRNELGELFQPETPDKQSFEQTDMTKKTLKKAFPKLRIKQSKPIRFTCTQQKLFEYSGQPRRFSQRQLAGASCQEIFTFLAKDKQTIKISGNQYHWSHLIAHFLGGEASEKNLAPATAASNYETLNKIERFIAEKLISRTTESIHITVTPIYHKEALIADELIYTLEWQELDEQLNAIDKCEKVSIHPKSYQRSTIHEERTLEYMRKANTMATPLGDDEIETDLFRPK